MQIYKVKTPIHFEGKMRAAGDKLELHPDNALTRAFLHFKQIEAVNMPFTPQPAVVAPETKAPPIPVKVEPKATASQIVADFKAGVKGK